MIQPSYRLHPENRLPGSILEVRGEIPPESLVLFRAQAIENIANETNIPGFRKGRVPEDILVTRVGEETITEEATALAVQAILPSIFKERREVFLERPRVALTAVTAGQPAEFRITVPVLPKIALPDCRSIAQKKNRERQPVPPITDEEFERAFGEFQKLAGKTAKATGTSPLDDESVKRLGDFKDVADFKTKFREELVAERRRREKDKHRLLLIEALLTTTSIEVPEILIEAESTEMVREFRGDLARQNLTEEEYAREHGKTLEDLKGRWRPLAEKRVATELLLDGIAAAENLSPDPAVVQKEVARVRKHQPQVPEDEIKRVVTHILKNEKVLDWLEYEQWDDAPKN